MDGTGERHGVHAVLEAVSMLALMAGAFAWLPLLAVLGGIALWQHGFSWWMFWVACGPSWLIGPLAIVPMFILPKDDRLHAARN